jgi:uncharacterized membrane protein YoaK (UPF0700 family)
MTQLDRRAQVLALCLSALAGYVDAIGFIQIGGFFVSFMSGNSTRLAVGVMDHAADWMKAAGLILAFFFGVVGGSLVGRLFRRRHRAVLMTVVLMLIAAAAAAQTGLFLLSALALAFAMGAENATFERDGEVRVALTYMTGTFVKAGQRLAGAIMGESPWAWLPHMILWFALIAGAVAGAAMQTMFGALSLWCAVIVAALCCLAAGPLDAQPDDVSTASQAYPR